MNENSILKTEISILLESFPKATGGSVMGATDPNFPFWQILFFPPPFLIFSKIL